jgi:hypothetical protein
LGETAVDADQQTVAIVIVSDVSIQLFDDTEGMLEPTIFFKTWRYGE